jgi:predicted Fe-Mo cluster-binding NifX family protein
MKLAITRWTERVAPVFDVARKAILVEIDAKGDLKRTEIKMPESSAIEKVSFLLKQGVDELICGAISKPVYDFATNQGIEVHAFAAGEIEELVRAWNENRLKEIAFSMPGCGRGKCCRRNRGRQNCRGVR